MCCAVIAFFLSMSGPPAMFLICRYGRFWYLFPQAQIAYNDIFAFFAGKMFGKHKLIKVSPNKTVEGFAGGLIGNIFTTVIISNFMLKRHDKDFWICRTHEYTVAPFYNYTCSEYDFVFNPTRYELPFTVMGVDHITCLPAQILCVVFGVFASLVGPFAGFLASGAKRAYGIKDFGTFLPGHGGILDRFDCQIFSVIFCASILSQFIFRDEMASHSIEQSFATDLSREQQAYILSVLKKVIDEQSSII